MTSHEVRHVVIVTDHAHINGGSAKVAIGEAIALGHSGLEVTVFAGVGPVDEQLSAVPNVRVVCLDEPDILSDPDRAGAAVRGIWNFSAAREMRKTLQALDPRHTVVHVHGWTKALSPSVLRVALNAGFPVVTTLHEFFTVCPLGSFYNHRTEQICTLAPMSGRCFVERCDSRNYAHKLWRYVRQAVTAGAGGTPRRLRHYITVSALSRSVLEPHLPEASTFYAVPNPIDVRRVEPADPGAHEAFSFVGRLSPEKGAELFARAAAIADVPAVFIGDGECADAVRAANPQARILGWLPYAFATEQMRSSRALVFPSLWYEVAGLVVAEAAANGIPAIVPRTSAAREAIVDGETGLLFDRADANDLAAKMRVLCDPSIARRMGRAAAARYWAAPNAMSTHVDTLLDVYERVLDEAA